MGKGKGFEACGVYYEMGEPDTPYIEYLKGLLTEIRQNSINSKK